MQHNYTLKILICYKLLSFCKFLQTVHKSIIQVKEVIDKLKPLLTECLLNLLLHSSLDHKDLVASKTEKRGR